MTTDQQTYPYIMLLDDGRRLVVDRLPSDSGPDRLVAYTLGPIDWPATVMLNPDIVEKFVPLAERIAEKFKRQP